MLMILTRSLFDLLELTVIGYVAKDDGHTHIYVTQFFQHRLILGSQVLLHGKTMQHGL